MLPPNPQPNVTNPVPPNTVVQVLPNAVNQVPLNTTVVVAVPNTILPHLVPPNCGGGLALAVNMSAGLGSPTEVASTRLFQKNSNVDGTLDFSNKL